MGSGVPSRRATPYGRPILSASIEVCEGTASGPAAPWGRTPGRAGCGRSHPYDGEVIGATSHARLAIRPLRRKGDE
jgi:hypothetical protein